MTLWYEFVGEHQKWWELFSLFVCFKIGGGRRVQFWYDNCCVYAALEDRFPELFLIVLDE